MANDQRRRMIPDPDADEPANRDLLFVLLTFVLYTGCAALWLAAAYLLVPMGLAPAPGF